MGFKPHDRTSSPARNRSNCRQVDDTPSGGREAGLYHPRLRASTTVRPIYVLPTVQTRAPFSTLYPLGDSRSLTAQSTLSEAWQNSGHPSPVMCISRFSPWSNGFPILSICSQICIRAQVQCASENIHW